MKGLVALGLISLALNANAHVKNEQLCGGFLPPNDMYIPVDNSPAATIAKAKFDEVLDKVQNVYGPIVRQMGGNLRITRRWTDGTVNAYANRQGSNWIITMFGGFARHPDVTADGFLAVACHELGHHIGGAPKIGRNWASNEGQSDYFSVLKCLRRIFETEDNLKALEGMTVDPAAEAACNSQHGSQKDQLVCLRSSLAAMSLAKVLAEGTPNGVPKFTTPDPSQVTKTYDGHPQAQCRLDTLFEAALCRVPFAQDLSNTNYQTGACVAPNDSRGLRPRCWFKPN